MIEFLEQNISSFVRVSVSVTLVVHYLSCWTMDRVLP